MRRGLRPRLGMRMRVAKTGVSSSGGGGGWAGLGDGNGVPTGGTAAPRAGLGAGPKLPDFQEKPGNRVVKS